MKWFLIFNTEEVWAFALSLPNPARTQLPTFSDSLIAYNDKKGLHEKAILNGVACFGYVQLEPQPSILAGFWATSLSCFVVGLILRLMSGDGDYLMSMAVFLSHTTLFLP